MALLQTGVWTHSWVKELSLLIDGSVDRTSGDAQATRPPVRKLWTAFLVSSHSLGWVNPISPSGFLGLTSQDSWSSYCLWVLTSHLSDLTALQEGPEGHQLATCSAVCMRDTAFTHTDRSCIVPRGHIPLLNCKPQAAKALSSESQGGATSPMEQLGWTGSHFSGLLWGMVIWVPHRQDSWSVLLSAPSPPTASLLPAVAFLHLTFDGLVPR